MATNDAQETAALIVEQKDVIQHLLEVTLYLAAFFYYSYVS